MEVNLFHYQILLIYIYFFLWKDIVLFICTHLFPENPFPLKFQITNPHKLFHFTKILVFKCRKLFILIFNDTTLEIIIIPNLIQSPSYPIFSSSKIVDWIYFHMLVTNAPINSSHTMYRTLGTKHWYLKRWYPFMKSLLDSNDN